jgi:hypothetical protein
MATLLLILMALSLRIVDLYCGGPSSHPNLQQTNLLEVQVAHENFLNSLPKKMTDANTDETSLSKEKLDLSFHLLPPQPEEQNTKMPHFP